MNSTENITSPPNSSQDIWISTGNNSGNATGNNSILLPENLSGALAQPNNSTGYQQIDTGTSSFSWTDYLNAITVVFIMLFALYAGLWLLRKYGRGRIIPAQAGFKRENLKVEAQLGLAHKKQLMVVKYFDKRLLLGLSDENIVLLSTDTIEETDVNQASPNPQKNSKSHKSNEAFEKFIAEAEKPLNNTEGRA